MFNGGEKLSLLCGLLAHQACSFGYMYKLIWPSDWYGVKNKALGSPVRQDGKYEKPHNHNWSNIIVLFNTHYVVGVVFITV